MQEIPPQPVDFEAKLPVCYSTEIRFGKNRARQLLDFPEKARIDLDANPAVVIKRDGTRIPLIRSAIEEIQPHSRYLRIPSNGLQHPLLTPIDALGQVFWDGDLSCFSPSIIRQTWVNSINYKLGDKNTGQPGLRLPQLGALHSVLGYWTTGTMQPATVVMPTGTGKTETMIALLVAAQPERLLVIVPSDVLRTQIAQKFETFGVLQQYGVINPNALRPVVGQLKQAFPSPETAKEFCENCNVIVATPSALFASASDAMSEVLASCSHLVVDEAHHVEANTWRKLRDAFSEKPVLQFTATPFREDGRRIAGQIIYAFPLRQAQKLHYFSTINYLPVSDFKSLDRTIAREAINRLRMDIEAGFDHILMARVKRIGRADEILEMYDELAPDLAPVILHSSLTTHMRRESLDAIRKRNSRIIICVDMLGEGFDLPNLKIAAIHDAHKSLGITLQFIGRFARSGDPTIGIATIVTGKPEGHYDENLRKLYSEEPDWNLIVRDLSEMAVGREQGVSEFDAEFTSLPEDVSIQNISLKMSTVIYRTKCEIWNPQAIYDYFPEEFLFTTPIAINEKSRVAWFILEIRTPVVWGELETIYDVRYDFHAIYWDEINKLLYVNGSNTESVYDNVAKVVCGEDVELIKGEAVYRAMAGINRLVPTNVGLLDVRNRSRRFSMHVGADVIEGFPVAEAQTKTKTNIFANGYENGIRVSIGGSLKGRLWSYRVASSIKDWVDWCNLVGKKVTDESINTDNVMKGFIRPQTLEERPPYVAIGVEWSWELFTNTSDEVRVRHDGSEWPLLDTDLRISNFTNSGNIRFLVYTPEWQAEYEANFLGGRMNFRALGDEIFVVTQRSQISLSEYLSKHGLTILLEQDGTIVPPGLLLKPNRELPPFEVSKIVTLDWAGIDIKKESQGPNRDADSIQAKAIEYINSLSNWDLVIDDDGSGEIADIVALKAEGESLKIYLVHCKYSSEKGPGGRVEDLYEVCGQAQKSVAWRKNLETLFRNLIRREKNRQSKYGRSGVLVGNPVILLELQEKSRFLRPDLSIFIAQPGVSKERISPQQLELLGSTDVYIHEVANASFFAICSK